MEDNEYKPWRKIPDEIKCSELPPVPISIPDKGSIGKTGEWRTLYPVIDEEKCNMCLICWSVCPEGIIYKKGDKLYIDLDYCKGCGICAYECPRKAIEMKREEK